MEADLIGAQHLGTQFGHHLTIDGDDTCLDELIGLTTTADTGISQEFVQTNRLIGIIVLLLILNTFLQAVFSIGIIAGSVGTITATLLAIATLALLAIAALALLIAATLLTIATLTGLTVAATLLTVATLTGLTVTATLLTIATLTGLVAATLLAIATLTGLIATFLALSLLVVTGAIAFLLTILGTGTIASLVVIVVTRTIATLMGLAILALRLTRTALQTCAKALRTETALLLILITVIAALTGVGTRLMNAGTR